ncbi:hypothetical protein L2725_10970 [Shewanella corallii]|uniref:SiaC family regulatory phosphoprotein domain-containing protein n=1 Tax=Shewanella corallii TaxID=560080 RepID=A0ABT0N753_9GAMM|nr:hypothetical protein [Shewanella corallii]MCL2914289.1 hypothetical protein [Shewanella corallii]
MEVIRLRNEFVHPKIKNIKTEVGKMEDMGSHYALPMDLIGEQWKALNIPKRGLFWDADSAKTVLTCISQFMKYIFHELLKKTNVEIQCTLLSKIEISNSCMPMGFDAFLTEIEEANKNEIDFTFLIEE